MARCSPSVGASVGLTATDTAGPRTPAPTAGGSEAPGSPAAGARSWERVNLGFVSAYILIRGGEAALVDTGEAGSEAAIESSLTSIGLGWSNVGHVIITHSHG